MKDYQRTIAPAWIGVAISFYAFIAIGIAEAGLGVLLPSIVSTYNLTSATVTVLFVSQISGYILAAFTSSLVSSRLGLARMLLIAAGALTMALMIYATSASWFVMVAAGAELGLGIGLLAWWQLPDRWISLPLIGFGLAAIFPATIWLIPQRLPDPLVPAAVSFATSAASFGAALIPIGAGWIAFWASLEIIPMLMLPLALLMVGSHCWLVQQSPKTK